MQKYKKNIKIRANHYYGAMVVAQVALLLLFVSCYFPPELSVVPKIELGELIFIEGNIMDPKNPDKIVVKLKFEDGNGDLGLGSDSIYINRPFHQFDYLRDENNSLIRIGSDPTLPPYNCQDWHILTDTVNGKLVVTDTVLVERNLYHNNIFIDFFVKKNGVMQPFNWLDDKLCGEIYHGRFPILSDNSIEGPLVGELTYRMQSSGFLFTFKTDTVQLKIHIFDRALNKSNEITTPKFTLQSIMSN